MTADRGSALAVPAFRALFGAVLVSDTGDWLLLVALPLVVLRDTGSALGTATAFVLELVPPVVLAPLASRLAARLPLRPLLLGVLAVQAVALLPLLLAGGPEGLPLVYAVILAQAACSTVAEPAKQALVPALVGGDRLVSANALVGLGNDVGRIVGASLGGVLLAGLGIAGVAVADALSFLVAGLLVALVPAVDPRRIAPTTGRIRARLGGVPAALVARATRGPLVVVLVASIAQGLFVVLFVYFVTRVIGGGAADVGLLRGAQGVGAVTAGVLLGAGLLRLRPARLLIVGLGAFTVLNAVSWNLAPLTRAVPVYGVLFASLGAPAVLFGAGLISLLQEEAATGPERGAVFAALGVVQACGQAVGLLSAGLLQPLLGIVPMLEVQAGLYAAATVLALVLLPRRSPRPATRRHPDPVSG